MKDLTGYKIGRLTVISFSHYNPLQRLRIWLCACECGNQTKVSSAQLNAKRTKSCGCLRNDSARERLRAIATKHGGYKTREFSIWTNMLTRCYNPRCKDYPSYGGRGISVCDEWKKSFSAFIGSMGKAPSDKTLDRIDNDGDYEPSNCRWATRKDQCNNYRRNLLVTYNGMTKNATQWATVFGLKPHTVIARIKTGWTAPRLFSQPSRRRKLQDGINVGAL